MKTYNTTLVYIEKDDKYLMLHRNKKKNDINEGRANTGVDIVLTGNPSEEEIMSIILPEGREVSFDGVKINAENSVDGKEHDIHSFDEWREYCKPAKDPGKYASPVVK